MKRPTVWLAACAALLITSAPAAKPPAPDAALAPGTIIPSANDVVLGGWRLVYRGHYTKRDQRSPQALTESMECCFATFEKGNAVLVARTEVVSRNAQGEPATERIRATKWITRKRDESITDCQLLWISPQLSLYDNKTEAIRSVVIENGEFVVIQWRDPGSYCSFGD